MIPLGPRQTLVLILFTGMTALVAAVFLYVAAGARQRTEFRPLQARGYALRAEWFKLLLGLCALAFTATLFTLPYPAGASQAGQGALQVSVKGAQWTWELSTTRLPAHRLIEFDVTSVDVNHGFGIYSPEGILLGQVQAMPGYVNHLFFRFPHPGLYLVRCMEYCGIFHPEMWIQLHVYGSA